MVTPPFLIQTRQFQKNVIFEPEFLGKMCLNRIEKARKM